MIPTKKVAFEHSRRPDENRGECDACHRSGGLPTSHIASLARVLPRDASRLPFSPRISALVVEMRPLMEFHGKGERLRKEEARRPERGGEIPRFIPEKS